MSIWYWYFDGSYRTHIGACSLYESGAIGNALMLSESVWIVPGTITN